VNHHLHRSETTLYEATARWPFSLVGWMPVTLFGWMPTIRIFGCEPGRAKRRQDVVAIFGTMPPAGIDH